MSGMIVTEEPQKARHSEAPNMMAKTDRKGKMGGLKIRGGYYLKVYTKCQRLDFQLLYM